MLSDPTRPWSRKKNQDNAIPRHAEENARAQPCRKPMLNPMTLPFVSLSQATLRLGRTEEMVLLLLLLLLLFVLVRLAAAR